MANEEISIFPDKNVVYATFGQRFAAGLLDGIILFIPLTLIRHFIGGGSLFAELYRGHVNGASILRRFLNVVICWLYQALMESSKNQASIGQMALKIKVTDLEGSRVSFATASARAFAEYVSLLTICVGYFMMLWNSKSQMLHDKIAGTLIVKKEKWG